MSTTRLARAEAELMAEVRRFLISLDTERPRWDEGTYVALRIEGAMETEDDEGPCFSFRVKHTRQSAL